MFRITLDSTLRIVYASDTAKAIIARGGQGNQVSEQQIAVRVVIGEISPEICTFLCYNALSHAHIRIYRWPTGP